MKKSPRIRDARLRGDERKVPKKTKYAGKLAKTKGEHSHLSNTKKKKEL